MRGINAQRLRVAFEKAGVEFIPENGGGGGVRLKRRCKRGFSAAQPVAYGKGVKPDVESGEKTVDELVIQGAGSSDAAAPVHRKTRRTSPWPLCRPAHFNARCRRLTRNARLIAGFD